MKTAKGKIMQWWCPLLKDYCNSECMNIKQSTCKFYEKEILETECTYFNKTITEWKENISKEK